MIAARAIAVVALTVAAGGCGSASIDELPPAAGPARAVAEVGAARAVLLGRERVLELRDRQTGRRIARAAAGVGPTHVVAAGSWVYVTDTRGDALLVFATRPRLELVRRVYLPGGPSAIALDPVARRLYVTLSARDGDVVELAATGRPHPLLTRSAS
ncbi:YncE family protein [Baekduia sp. Peel2402]|uniref:YncE family protein n=1 Tax=Baekduia sp. Peel2402 TaxID=3458296 RepID=UPI00403EF681